MNERRRPPADISPRDLICSWLPAELDRLGSAAGLPDMRVRIELDGAGGGSWDLVLKAGKLTGGPLDAAQKPLVTLRLSVQDWRALAVGEPGPVTLTPPTASPTDLLFIDSASQQLLQNLGGSFAFEVEGYNGRTWRLLASFGDVAPGAAPDAVIRTDAQTYADILARKTSGPEAYFGGRITISGDAARGMQVGLALLPKF
jgi:hypothetical protein